MKVILSNVLTFALAFIEALVGIYLMKNVVLIDTFPDDVRMITGVVCLYFLFCVIFYLYGVISLIYYMNKLTDEELEEFLDNELDYDYDYLKFLLTSEVQHAEKENVKGKVKGIYIKWNEEKNKMDVACYVNGEQLYPIEDLLYLEEDDYDD